MPKGNNEGAGELDDFKQDFQGEDKSLEQDFPSTDVQTDSQEEVVTTEDKEGDTTEPRKNRRERRLLAKLEGERATSIQLARRLEALTEARQFQKEFGDKTPDERLIQLYGDDENGRKAAKLTQSLLEDTAKQTRALALEDFQNSQRESESQVRKESKFIDEALEDLEDESGIDLTSDSPEGNRNRVQFLDMVEKFSPKDEDGNIREYADFDEVFDVFQSSRKSGNNRNKDLASRGMVRGGQTNARAVDKVSEQYLKDAGII